MNNGDELGLISINVKVENSKYMKQMRACARTEKGVIPMIPLTNVYSVDLQKKKNKLATVDQHIANIEKMNM